MEIVSQGNSQSGNGGESLHDAFTAAMADPANMKDSGSPALVDGIEGAKAQEGSPKAPQGEASSSEAAEIEFEGKKIALDKTARDYALAELNAKKGMRKAFSERDAIKKQLEEISKKGNKWDQIESVFKQNGIQGLFDALAGEEGAYEKHAKEQEERAIRRYNATADELKIIEREEAIEATRKRAEAAERQLKEHTEKIKATQEAANTKILEDKIIAEQEKVSFAGKLGDPKKEEKFDSYVWERTRMRLNEYVQEKGIEAHAVPAKIISAMFQEEAADFADAFKSQIESATKAVVSKNSEAATLSAQAKTSSGISTTPRTLEQLADEHKGGIGSTLRALFGRPV
jgi:hypothetical protein